MLQYLPDIKFWHLADLIQLESFTVFFPTGFRWS